MIETKIIIPEPDETYTEYVELCLNIAVDVHKGQVDKINQPMILHPITVGMSCETYLTRCVGFLHDVLEDTETTPSDLENLGVHKDIIDAVKILTHKEGEIYFDYIKHICKSKNKTAMYVKIKDLEHNIERCKLTGFTALCNRYETALSLITEAYNK